jgi:hypothetical protein
MKTIAKDNIPGRRDFKQRFNRKLGGTAKLFDPISEQLAEEAESFIMEVWLEKLKDNTVFIKRKGPAYKQNHYCSNCQNHKYIQPINTALFAGSELCGRMKPKNLYRMTVMIPLQPQVDYTELKFTLRSIEKWTGVVIIVGEDLPEWITNVTRIEVSDIKGKKQLSIRKKIISALEYRPEFLFLSDDVYLLSEPKRVFYSSGTLKQIGEGGSKPLQAQLEKLNKPTKCFDVHCPIFYEREKFKALECFTSECIIKSAYGNFHEVESINMPDFKINHKMTPAEIKQAIKDRPYFSTGPQGLKYALPVLQELFSNKSKFEL